MLGEAGDWGCSVFGALLVVWFIFGCGLDCLWACLAGFVSFCGRV